MAASRDTYLKHPNGVNHIRVPSIGYTHLHKYYLDSGRATTLTELQNAMNVQKPITLHVIKENEWYSLDYSEFAWINTMGKRYNG